MIFDTHCHLGYDGDDPTAVHARARAAGVTLLLNVGIDLATSARARATSAQLGNVHWSAGLHPSSAGQWSAEWPALAALCAEPSCRAIGETGLDFYRDHSTPAQQEHSLLQHLALARELGKPVVLHCRDAFTRLYELLAPAAPVAGVMHCFTGGIQEAQRAVELGLHLSFAGPLTYPRSEALRAAACVVPEARLLVETDAPFLPPQGRRGQRNEPAWITTTLAQLAQLRDTTFERMAEITRANGCQLFGVA